MGELGWKGLPQNVTKALGHMINKIVEECPEGHWPALRYGPKVETQQSYLTKEVVSIVRCRYYYLKMHNGDMKFGEVPEKC